MNASNRTLRTIAVIVLAVILLRLICSWTLGEKYEIFSQPEIASFLILADTGKVPQTTDPEEPADTTLATESTEPVTDPIPEETSEPPATAEPMVMPQVPEQGQTFTAADASYIEINYAAKRQPDVEALLTEPLDWDLTDDEPTVLLIHTHGTEAYTPTENNVYQEEGGEYRTTDNNCNMISIGEEMARLLREAGINVVHDTNFYDYPDYLSSYDNCRIGMEEQLKKYPSVKLVIDLHRDSAETEVGGQWATSCVINGERSAQVMLVMGTNVYYEHPGWEQNLSMALKFQALMEKTHPGSVRPLDLRKQRFNQDLNTGAMIAEIGSAGNTHHEAMNAASVLTEAIILLAKGANT